MVRCVPVGNRCHINTRLDDGFGDSFTSTSVKILGSFFVIASYRKIPTRFTRVQRLLDYEKSKLRASVLTACLRAELVRCAALLVHGEECPTHPQIDVAAV